MGNVDECKVLILLGGTQKNTLKQSDYVHDNIFQGISLSSEKSTLPKNQINCPFSSMEMPQVRKKILLFSN